MNLSTLFTSFDVSRHRRGVYAISSECVLSHRRAARSSIVFLKH